MSSKVAVLILALVVVTGGLFIYYLSVITPNVPDNVTDYSFLHTPLGTGELEEVVEDKQEILLEEKIESMKQRDIEATGKIQKETWQKITDALNREAGLK